MSNFLFKCIFIIRYENCSSQTYSWGKTLRVSDLRSLADIWLIKIKLMHSYREKRVKPLKVSFKYSELKKLAKSELKYVFALL